MFSLVLLPLAAAFVKENYFQEIVNHSSTQDKLGELKDSLKSLPDTTVDQQEAAFHDFTTGKPVSLTGSGYSADLKFMEAENIWLKMMTTMLMINTAELEKENRLCENELNENNQSGVRIEDIGSFTMEQYRAKLVEIKNKNKEYKSQVIHVQDQVESLNDQASDLEFTLNTELGYIEDQTRESFDGLNVLRKKRDNLRTKEAHIRDLNAAMVEKQRHLQDIEGRRADRKETMKAKKTKLHALSENHNVNKINPQERTDQLTRLAQDLGANDDTNKKRIGELRDAITDLDRRLNDEVTGNGEIAELVPTLFELLNSLQNY